MSDLGLLSSVHANVEDFASLVDDAILELQSGQSGGPSTARLEVLLRSASLGEVNNRPLRALMFESLVAGPSGQPLENLGDLASALQGGQGSSPALLSRLTKLAVHLEQERATIAHRLGR